MTRFVSRLALIGTCAIGFGGLVAVPAEAAVNTPAVTPATNITPESAVLNGVVDTGDLLPGTTYTFEYDTATDWAAGGDNAQFAPEVPGALDPSLALLPVSTAIGCHPMSFCNNNGELPLQPGTKYVYFLDSQPAASGSYLGTQSLISNEGTFTTPKLGDVHAARWARLAGSGAWIWVTNSSPLAAKGSIKVFAGSKQIAKGKFKLKPNATGIVKISVPSSVSGSGSTSLKVKGSTSTDQKFKGGTITLSK